MRPVRFLKKVPPAAVKKVEICLAFSLQPLYAAAANHVKGLSSNDRPLPVNWGKNRGHNLTSVGPVVLIEWHQTALRRFDEPPDLVWIQTKSQWWWLKYLWCVNSVECRRKSCFSSVSQASCFSHKSSKYINIVIPLKTFISPWKTPSSPWFILMSPGLDIE